MSDNKNYDEEFMEQFRDENGNPIPDFVDEEQDELAGLSVEQINEKIARIEAEKKAQKEQEEREEAIARFRRLRAETQRPAAVDNRMVMHDPVQPMVRHQQIDPQEYQWGQGRGQFRGPSRETGRYDAHCGNCGNPLSGFDNFCATCGQRRVEQRPAATPAPPPSFSFAPPAAPSAAPPAAQPAAPNMWEDYLTFAEQKHQLDMKQKLSAQKFDMVTGGSAPVATPKAPGQQQRGQRSSQPPQRQPNMRGRQSTPSRGGHMIAQPRSSQWVAPGNTKAAFVPKKWDGKYNYRVEKKISVEREKAAFEKLLKNKDRELAATKAALAKKEAVKVAKPEPPQETAPKATKEEVAVQEPIQWAKEAQLILTQDLNRQLQNNAANLHQQIQDLHQRESMRVEILAEIERMRSGLVREGLARIRGLEHESNQWPDDQPRSSLQESYVRMRRTQLTDQRNLIVNEVNNVAAVLVSMHQDVMNGLQGRTAGQYQQAADELTVQFNERRSGIWTNLERLATDHRNWIVQNMDAHARRAPAVVTEVQEVPVPQEWADINRTALPPNVLQYFGLTRAELEPGYVVGEVLGTDGRNLLTDAPRDEHGNIVMRIDEQGHQE
ncbi:MAG: hypothetical protein Q9180_004407 [Flavoplaca navasiana]